MSIRITELDAITSLQSGDYIAVDNESTGTHKFDALNIGSNIGQNIANTYSSSASYAIGQYCLYDNNLYKCTTTISTPEAWNSSHWIQVTVGEGLYEKVDKVSGKGLSTNDFTDEYKQKLGGIEAGAEVNVQANWTETNTLSDSYIQNKPENATTSTSGFMSASDKQKLDNIEAGAEVNVQPNWAENDSSKDDYIKNKPTIDTALSTSSNNAVRNSAITAGINTVQNNLNAEITARENAVSAEQTAREGAVSAEQTARENADNALDGRIDIIEETLPNKANINGSYEEMTVGSAEQLISTESIEDSELYIFRKSGNGADIGDRETDMLVGGTVAWNQLVQNGNFASTDGWSSYRNTLVASGNIATATIANEETLTYANINHSFTVQGGHKYILAYSIKSSANGNTGYYVNDGGIKVLKPISADIWTQISTVRSAISNSSTLYLYLPEVANAVAQIKNVMCIDLTLMFGSTIADYIYSLEQANVGDGVAWFKKYFPKSYYMYDAGSLQSVNVASHDMTGFNQWDEEWELGDLEGTNGTPVPSSNYIRSKNFCPCLSNIEYFCKKASTNTYVFWYDENKTHISHRIIPNDMAVVSPSGASYFKLTIAGTTYNHDICINISDTNRNGEYEEYIIHSYPYDESVELRGMPQLVDGELKYDGDTYELSGKVMRKYGIVDMGDLVWDNNGTIAGGNQWGTWSLTDKAYGELNLICSAFETHTASQDIGIIFGRASTAFVVVNSSITDLDQFKASVTGQTICYELATPVEEEAEGFTNPQIVDASGTEEYVDAGVKNNTRDMAIPVGHITQYVVNLRDKLQHLPFLAKEDGDYFVNQTGTQMKLKKVEGYYEDLVVGVADNLSTDIRTNDQTPYLFRTSGGSVDIGDREYINSVVGGTVAWNQLCTIEDFTQTADTDTAHTQYNVPFNIGHKYLATYNQLTTLTSVLRNTLQYKQGSTTIYQSASANRNLAKGAYHWIFESSLGGAVDFTIWVHTPDVDVSYSDFQLFDLTQMFGSTIADYIYSLEQATTGAGVAWFKKLFPNDYYDYNAGELKSVSGLVSHDMTGFNQFDGEWSNGSINATTGEITINNAYSTTTNLIPVIPNVTYYMKATLLSQDTADFGYYAKDKSFIQRVGSGLYNHTFVVPDGVYYLRVCLTNSRVSREGFCINLSWDGSRDGEYEPYELHSYPLDSDLTLRGIPKLDANNNLYYDGDVYESDGTVTRKYGIVDMGSLEWSYLTDATCFQAPIGGLKKIDSNSNPANIICGKYVTTALWVSFNDKCIAQTAGDTPRIRIKDSAYTDAATFKTAMSGVYLVYELATLTTESADSFTNPQIVDDFGTEEYVIDSTIDVPIPVGHNTDYPINLKSKLEMAPDSPDGDGDYIVRQTNGTNEYVPLIIEDQLPAVPSTDGTYTLTVTIANGEATYSWT